MVLLGRDLALQMTSSNTLFFHEHTYVITYRRMCGKKLKSAGLEPRFSLFSLVTQIWPSASFSILFFLWIKRPLSLSVILWHKSPCLNRLNVNLISYIKQSWFIFLQFFWLNSSNSASSWLESHLSTSTSKDREEAGQSHLTPPLSVPICPQQVLGSLKDSSDIAKGGKKVPRSSFIRCSHTV